VIGRRGRVAGVCALLFAAMAALVWVRLEPATGLTYFLSTDSRLELAAISSRLADAALTRTMILSVEAPDAQQAVAAARAWSQVLAAHPEVESLRAGPGEDLAAAVFELYFPRRHLFLSSRPEVELPERLSDAGLRREARALQSELRTPRAGLTQRIAGSDPLRAFAALARGFERASAGSLRSVDGQFVAKDAPRAILFLTTRHSAFDASHQAPFEAFLETSFAELDRAHGGSLSLERSAVHRFAVVSERQARRDMARISVLSVAGIVGLFALLFRSPLVLAVSLTPLLGGLLAAASLGLLLFGQLHVLTLVFGATLIGVCIDYPIHAVNHQLLLPDPRGPVGSMRRVRTALALGALTTAAGFAGLAWSDLPGVREIGVFSAIGTLAALLTTLVLVPVLMPASARSTGIQRALAAALARGLARLRRRRARLALLPAAAGLLCLAGLPRLSWDHEVYSLNLPLEPAWLAEDARVRDRVSRMDEGRFVVARGVDEEAALRRNDAVYQRLVDARRAGRLEDFRSLHAFLWSRELQERNWAALRAVPRLPERLAQAFEAEGFRGEAFAGFADALTGDAPQPLSLQELLDSPIAELVRPFHVPLDEGVGVLTFLRGVSDPAGLEQALEGLDGVAYYDQERWVEDLYARYRDRTLRLIELGLVGVLVILWLRYRRVGSALAAAAPALLAAATSVALLSLAGIALNLMHLLGLLLVLGFGVDYGVFLLEARSDARAVAASLLSICVACASTCLGFGLLAASRVPALQSLGLSIGVGVLLALVFAPSVLLLTEPGERGRSAS